ncbi:MAG: DNA-directed RNA polymerase subunit omega [Ruminococcaceae bacterium]|nr:DNA-directed RNA polymerase subunit omega [Oscillospiraceae bacterium]
MIYPTINDLSKGEYNRYEIALATAKCARMITNEYVHQREEAERAASGSKDGDKPMNTMIDKEVRDEKAVKIAIGRIYEGKYNIVHKDPAEQEAAEQAILEGLRRKYEEMYEYPDMNFAEDGAEDETAAAEEVEEGFEGEETEEEI